MTFICGFSWIATCGGGLQRALSGQRRYFSQEAVLGRLPVAITALSSIESSKGKMFELFPLRYSTFCLCYGWCVRYLCRLLLRHQGWLLSGGSASIQFFLSITAAKAKCLSYSRFATPHFAFAINRVFVTYPGFSHLRGSDRFHI